MLLVEHEKIVEITTDFARGLEQCRDAEARFGGEEFGCRGQRIELDQARRRQFAGNAGGFLSQPLLLFGEPLVFEFDLDHRTGYQACQQARKADEQSGRIEQQAAVFEQHETCAKADRVEAGDEPGRCLLIAGQNGGEPAAAARDQPDHQQAGAGQQQHFGGLEPGRAMQDVAVEQAFDDLRLDLDAGHQFAQRRGAHVLQARTGKPDQDQLVLDQFGRHLAFEYGGGGYLARYRFGALGEMQPDFCAGLHRDFEVGNGDGLDAERADAGFDGRDARADTQHFQSHRGHHLVADRHQQRNPAHDRILQADREQGLAVGRRLQLGQAGEHPREVPQVRRRVFAAAHHRNRLHATAGGLRGEVEAGRTEHTGRRAQRSGKARLVAGQSPQFRGELLAIGRQVGRHLRRRRGIGFRHVHVESDRRRLQEIDRIDQLGKAVARPGPLPDPLEAVLVDFDDGHRLRTAYPRRQLLVTIEEELPATAKGLGQRAELAFAPCAGVGRQVRRLAQQAQRGQHYQDQQRDGTPAAGKEDLLQEIDNALHRSITSPSQALNISSASFSRVSASKRRVSCSTPSICASSELGS